MEVAAGAAIATVAALLSACAAVHIDAAEMTQRPEYVGRFTGEYVDGKPVYRFPTIEVIGHRSGADDD